MSVSIIINNSEYEIPTSGTNADWGEALTDAIVALSNVVGTLSGPFDVLTSSSTIFNINTTQSPNGYIFSSADVRSFESRYVITRKITKQISSISVDIAGEVTIQTSTDHDLSVGDFINITGSNSTNTINGSHEIISTPDSITFTIAVVPGSVTIAGTSGNFNVTLVQSARLHGMFGMQGWVYTHFAILGDAKVVVSLNKNTGQIELNADIMSGTGYLGTFTFSGGAFVQD
jgi:hypothetical protein